MVDPKSGECVLDLAAGTGAFSKEIKRIEPAARLIAADFCAPILKTMPDGLATKIGADALCLPFKDGAFDVLVIAFGVRNFSDIARGLSEMNRVMKPGARGLILEFLRPENSLFGFLYKSYLRLWIPLLGGILSGSFDAYRHLTRTIHGFLTRQEIRAVLAECGFEAVSIRELTFGAASAIFFRKG